MIEFSAVFKLFSLSPTFSICSRLGWRKKQDPLPSGRQSERAEEGAQKEKRREEEEEEEEEPLQQRRVEATGLRSR